MSSTQRFTLYLQGVDVEHLREEQERLMQAQFAKNTLDAYAVGWTCFTRWCQQAGREALPATSETIALYWTWCIRERGYRYETAALRMTAIQHNHRKAGYESPLDRSVRRLIRSTRRELRELPAGKAALTPEHLERLSKSLLESKEAIAARDRAVLILGFALGWRGNETAGLQLSDVRFVKQGLRVRLGASKTDQDGHEGREVGIPYGKNAITCPVRALKAWLSVRGDWRGPLFCRISSGGTLLRQKLMVRGVSGIVKRRLREVGVDPEAFGSHSLRAGMATAAAEAGASEIAIMQRGGWKSFKTVLKYVRPAKAFRGDPLAGVL